MANVGAASPKQPLDHDVQDHQSPGRHCLLIQVKPVTVYYQKPCISYCAATMQLCRILQLFLPSHYQGLERVTFLTHQPSSLGHPSKFQQKHKMYEYRLICLIIRLRRPPGYRLSAQSYPSNGLWPCLHVISRYTGLHDLNNMALPSRVT